MKVKNERLRSKHNFGGAYRTSKAVVTDQYGRVVFLGKNLPSGNIKKQVSEKGAIYND